MKVELEGAAAAGAVGTGVAMSDVVGSVRVVDPVKVELEGAAVGTGRVATDDVVGSIRMATSMTAVTESRPIATRAVMHASQRLRPFGMMWRSARLLFK